MSFINRFYLSLITLLLFTISMPSQAGGAVGANLTIGFNPSTIGSGSNSRLRFTFNSIEAAVVTDIAVVDNLPAGIAISSSANYSSDCAGVNVVAPNGGATISISGISLVPSSSCNVEVNVTSNVVNTHTNITDNITSSSGTGNNASANLVVVADRPSFSKSFSPSAVTLGSPSTLTFTIDNSLSASSITQLNFSDTFPTGMIIASPANASTTCVGPLGLTLTADAGSNQVSLNASGFNASGFEVLLAGASCTVSVDVIAGSVGILVNQSSNLNVTIVGVGVVDSGFAVDTLNVSVQSVVFTKDFIDDPIAPGGTGVLRFNILNTDRNNATSNMAFTDDLDGLLSGLAAIGLPQNNVCGSGSALTGTGLITLSGGNLPAEGSCSFDVPVQVPVNATSGLYVNNTSTLTGDLNGSGFVINPAVSNLFIQPIPLLTKTFTDDPVGAGSDVTLEFTVINTSLAFPATDISFTDNLGLILPGGTVVTPLNLNNACGAGSLVQVQSLNPPPPSAAIFTLALSGGNLPANGSCTFSVTISIPDDMPNGTYTNITGPIVATVDGVVYTGFPANDDLVIVAAPQLTKEFTTDPVTEGGIVTLEFTLNHDLSAGGNATDITFTDDLNTTLAGLTAIGLPLNNVCGSGSSISGTTNLTFTAGTLAPGEICTFSVNLQLPATVASGTYTNITSPVTATVLGVTANGNFAADNLQVANITFTKSFLSASVQAGGTVDLQFTINNTSTLDISSMFFLDTLSNVLPGATDLMANGVMPTDPCGVGSTIAGPSTLILTGGNLLAGTSCSFIITLDVSAGAINGNYINTTSDLTIGTPALTLPPAIDALTISSDLLALTKTFTDDPVAPGGTVTLEFTIENFDLNNAASDITFTDDLDAALTGLIASGLPTNDVCGIGSVVSGTNVLTLTGASLAAGASCTFSVTLQVPMGVSSSVNTNTTSAITGTINALPANGPPATDDLLVQLVTFSKSFDAASTATGTPLLTYTIGNLDASFAVNNLTFSDDLDAVITGLVATGLPVNNTCGIGSTIVGTSFITFTGGNIAPSGSCSFGISLLVPGNASMGTYPSSTSTLTASGLLQSVPAMADLVIEPAPLFSKTFVPAFIGLNQTSILSFDINNTASAIAANNSAFVDNLPAGMVLDTFPIVNNTCGGTLIANNGGSVVSLNNGSVTSGSSCNIQVRIVGIISGTHNNVTGDLTSSSGNSSTASDTLVVNTQPLFSKSFTTNPIFSNSISTLMFSIDNNASTVNATALNFVDNLPAGMQVAAVANASTTCTGGTLTAVAASTMIAYTSGTVNAGGTCTLSVDVTTTVSGALINVSGNLTSSLGTSGTATDALQVNPPPSFSKQFAPTAINPNEISQLTLTVDNSASTVVATALDFTDSFPANLVVATPANASTTCTGGAITATSGTSALNYTGGSIAADSSCIIQVDVTSTIATNYVNVTGDLTSNHGNSGQATDSLLVTVTPILSKSFTNNPALLNAVNTLTFTIDNSANGTTVTALAFADSMPIGFQVANPANVSTTCTGGTITANIGSNSIGYSGGSIAANSNCNIVVDVIGTVIGSYTNTTSVLSTSLGDGNQAMADIAISSVPLFSKSFGSNPAALNAANTLTFTIDNSVNSTAVTALAFTDTMPTGFQVANPANVSTTCTGGTITANIGSNSINYSGGSIAANSNCNIVVDVIGTVNGLFTNTTSVLSTSLGDGNQATADIAISSVPLFSKSFGSNPAALNAVNTLTFSIDNSVNSTAVTALAFTDIMPTGFQIASPANVSTTCTGGTITANIGSNSINYSGGSIAANSNCNIVVDVIGTVNGSFTNTTSVLSTSLGDGSQAMADIAISSVPLFSKSFGSNPAALNAVNTLTFSIDNSANGTLVTALAFTDAMPTGFQVASPANSSTTCTGGTITANIGSNSIGYSNGSVAANGSCTIVVDVIGTVIGSFTNTTSILSTSLGDGNQAVANISISSAPLFSQSFAPNIIGPNGISTLSFSINNSANAIDASNFGFVDNLPTGLTVAANPNVSHNCTASTVVANANANTISASNGSVAANTSCQINVDVTATATGVYTNTTGDFTSSLGNSGSASADLTVAGGIVLTKSFAVTTIGAGDAVELFFTITNNSTIDATQITFNDDLSAFISGTTATNLPQNDMCGLGSSLTGTTDILLQNGIVLANSSCQFSVMIDIPLNVPSGNYTNVTSPIDANFNGSIVIGGSASTASDIISVVGVVQIIPVLDNLKTLVLLMLLVLLMAGFYKRKHS